jgi:hypothetical protein
MTKTLLYDIETSPSLGYVWGKWQQDVIQFKEEWYILCFAYKWLDEKKTHVVALPDFKRYKKDPTNDYDVVQKLHDLFSEADIVIAHNGNSFDQKKSQARMLYHEMIPPVPYQQIDTKLVARRSFNFNSNKLDDLGEMLKVGKKLETGGFATWLGCMNGDKKAWEKMKKYNKQDVILLEKIYLKLRPWDRGHPALNVMDNRPEACPKCAGTNMNAGMKYHSTKTGSYQYFRCQDCGGMAKSRIPEYKQAFEKVKYVN